MRTLIHLSDIHFGRIDPATLRPLIDTVSKLEPDVVAVSGDLTQRARSSEFRAAREFLDALPGPQIVVPGNHDVPLHNVYARFTDGLAKYHRYISEDADPFYSDSEIAVAGVNTARAFTWKGGRIGVGQIQKLRSRLCSFDRSIVKVIVTHHPFDLPAGIAERGSLVGRSKLAMKHLAECGADLFLAGHLHLTYSGDSILRYKIEGHSALIIQAGTATSVRGRGQSNSFNVIRIDRDLISVERKMWNSMTGTFEPTVLESYSRSALGFVSLPPAAIARS